LSDAAEKRPLTARLDLPFQEVASLRNGRFPLLAGLFPARETKAALRQAWVLDEVIETKEGLVVYPAGLEAESV
jgi:hypothetical protein